VPARRALIKEGIDSLLKLSRYRESEIVALHGLGQRSIPKLKNALKENGLAFKE
jgi:DNA-directed RNA polymerase alpha subunit